MLGLWRRGAGVAVRLASESPPALPNDTPIADETGAADPGADLTSLPPFGGTQAPANTCKYLQAHASAWAR